MLRPRRGNSTYTANKLAQISDMRRWLPAFSTISEDKCGQERRILHSCSALLRHPHELKLKLSLCHQQENVQLSHDKPCIWEVFDEPINTFWKSKRTIEGGLMGIMPRIHEPSRLSTRVSPNTRPSANYAMFRWRSVICTTCATPRAEACAFFLHNTAHSSDHHQ